MEENYKRLIEVILPLNHDRYKTYFVQFFSINLAIFTGLVSDFTKEVYGGEIVLIIMGLSLSSLWFWVQRKISLDNKNVWEMLEQYENSDDFSGKIKIYKTPKKPSKPTSIMILLVPLINRVRLHYFPA